MPCTTRPWHKLNTRKAIGQYKSQLLPLSCDETLCRSVSGTRERYQALKGSKPRLFQIALDAAVYESALAVKLPNEGFAPQLRAGPQRRPVQPRRLHGAQNGVDQVRLQDVGDVHALRQLLRQAGLACSRVAMATWSDERTRPCRASRAAHSKQLGTSNAMKTMLQGNAAQAS